MDRLRFSPLHTLIIIILLMAFTPAELYSQQDISNDGPNLMPDNVEKKYSKEVTALIEYFDAKKMDIRPMLEDTRFEMYEGISKRFTNAVEVKSGSLDDYKRVLGFEQKKNKIYDFMTTYSEALNAAEEEYGIPKYVISAIIGVESSFGKNVGKYNPFSVYVSMYSENHRSEFARAQLEELLVFTKNNELDIFELKSSYAGAMSYAQFIPYSLNRWFVGADILDMDSCILSVANYLAHFKEKTGSMEKAVYRYNPSQMYTDAVLALAKEAELLYALK